MKAPIDILGAEALGLLADHGKGVHTFSNGTEWECWADGNCWECWWWDENAAGRLCAFEGAALLGMVSPALAERFGWTRHEKYPESWCAPDRCPFFAQRPDRGDDGEFPEPPPPPDPLQLVLIADPTEDIAQVAAPAPAELAGAVP